MHRRNSKRRKAAGLSQVADGAIAPLIEGAVTNDDGVPFVVAEFSDGEAALLQELFNSLKKRRFRGVAILVVPEASGTVHLGVYVDKEHTDSFQAGKLIAQFAPIIGGKGGGKPEMARGAGNDANGISKLLDEAKKTFGVAK